MAETPVTGRWLHGCEDPNMDTNAFSQICAALPAATETLQWGDNRVFKIGGKMFAVADSAPDGRFSFKVADERFLELSDLPGFRPAPYLARARWVQVDPAATAIPDNELETLVRESYEIIFGRLTRKLQRELRPE
jgi:predicted DNA-binding protein (MmcQ/YjbR family)